MTGIAEGLAAGASFKLDHKALEDFINTPDGPVAKGITTEAVQVERAAKRNCPVDTGRLRASITHGLGKDGEGIYADVGSNVDYAAPVEFTQPYLRPALVEKTGSA